MGQTKLQTAPPATRVSPETFGTFDKGINRSRFAPTNTQQVPYLAKDSTLTIAGNVLRKPSSPLEPAPAAALGDISHLLKSRGGGVKSVTLSACLPSHCESSKTVITSRRQYAAAERLAEAPTAASWRPRHGSMLGWRSLAHRRTQNYAATIRHQIKMWNHYIIYWNHE